MTPPKTSPLKPGQTRAGFVLLKRNRFESSQIEYYEFKHEKTGAKYVHLQNDDDENVFAVAFRTTPDDSTGVAHILEHVALAGSQNYPVRDPFFSMRNRSLKTFMNAFTASDWTMYPFATQNKKDFYNLMGIYLDASFFPLISKESFLQEGFRLEFEDDGQGGEKPAFKGVVFNEMKGAMSTQQNIMFQSVGSALFPTITYGKNSGGEPRDIPSLTWRQLKEFHARHYHPSNAWFFTYGSLPVEEHLDFVDRAVLERFEKIDPKTEVPDEQRYAEPQSFEFDYQAGDGEGDEDSHQIALTWLTCPVTDSENTLSLNILGDILLGNSAAPLRKALMESKLGKSLADTSGFEDGCRETSFSAGLQGVKKTDLDKVETLILNTLEDIAENGFEPSLIESAVHQFELHMREISGRGYPYGLSLLLRNFDRWMHGGPFEEGMELDGQIKKIRNSASRQGYFEGLIKKFLLNNCHRVKVILKPNPEHSQNQDKLIANLLAEKAAALGPDEIEQVKAEAAALEAGQSAKEDLSVLPKVSLGDVPKEPKFFPHLKETPEKILFYEQPANGILYVNLRAALPKIDESIRADLPFILNLITSAGTETMSYDQVSLQIAGNTGGIGFDADADLHASGNLLESVNITGKALKHKSDRLFDLIGTLFREWSFKDFDRIRSLARQSAVSQKNSILQAGHSFANSLCKRNMNTLTKLSETYGGISHVQFSQKIAAMSDAELKKTIERWSETIPKIFEAPYQKLALIGDAETLSAAEKNTGKLLELFPAGTPPESSPMKWSDHPFVREIHLMPASVAYVARCHRAPLFNHPDSPAMTALSALLETKFIHREVREKGGAYGGNCGYSPDHGAFSFTSYRDPNLADTWQTYSNSVEWLAEGDFTEEDVEESKLMIFGRMDKPLSPSGKAVRELGRNITGKTPEMIKNFRNGLFDVSKEDLIRAGETWLSGEYSEAAITGPEILDNNRDSDLIKNHEIKQIFSSDT